MKSLYPLKFIPIPSKRVWGGSDLISRMHKEFVEVDEKGNEHRLTVEDRIGESWEIADMGIEDSVVSNGWLAGNTVSELMETYMDRIVGEEVYSRYGRQFPLLVKFLDIQGKLSVQVHPDDVVAAERYDLLGKNEMWYVLDASEDAVIYAGFNREMSAQELYDRCHDGSVASALNVIRPRRGDWLQIVPGTVHAAEGGLLVAEIQESSDLTFRLYDWGREFDPATARTMHLEEAIDLIDYGRFDEGMYHKGASHAEPTGETSGGIVQPLLKCPQFTVNKLNVKAPLQVSTQISGSFIIYICIEGSAVIRVEGQPARPVSAANPATCSGSGSETSDRIEDTVISKGETVLIPADMPDFMIYPTSGDTVLLEAMVEPEEEIDSYINPDTEPFLEGEDYEGLENEDDGSSEDED